MEVSPVEAGFSAVRLERISTHLQDRYITPGKIKGAQVMVSRRGVPAYFRSFGEMDAERGKPVDAETIFRIYSMTKPITSVALMMLFEEGHFQLNDPVSRFIPAWADHQVWVEGSYCRGWCHFRGHNRHKKINPICDEISVRLRITAA